MSAFTIGQGFLLGVTLYIAVPSLMVFLSLVVPAKLIRMANIVLASLYAVTVAGGVVGESNYYYVLGSAAEIALLAGVVYYAWTWPKAPDAVVASSRHGRMATPAQSSQVARALRRNRPVFDASASPASAAPSVTKADPGTPGRSSGSG